MAETAEKISITKRQLRGWKRETADILVHIINTCQVKYRLLDGSHVLLYPPDGESRPFKVSAARTVEVNRQILEVQFIKAFGLTPYSEMSEPDSPDSPPDPSTTSEYVVEMAERVDDPDTAPEPIDLALRESVREAVTSLGRALGLDVLDSKVETEALEALERVSALENRLAAVIKERDSVLATGKSVLADNERLLGEIMAERREVKRLAGEVEKQRGLADEWRAKHDAIDAKFAALRDLFK